MKKALLGLVLVLVAAFLVSKFWLNSFSPPLPPAYVESQLPQAFAAQIADAPTEYLIENVHLITMHHDSVWRDQMVLVKYGLIDSIGSNLQAPGLPVIDGNQGYLLPSFSDMHVHINSDEQLILFIAHGVTTVRNMFGDPIHLNMSQQIQKGAWLGPKLINGSPIFEGPNNFWPGSIRIHNHQEASEQVVAAKAQGYDFIKVYHSLPVPQYREVLRIADSVNIPVAGHLPEGWPVDQALPDLWSFEHLSPRDLGKFVANHSAEQTLKQFAQSDSWFCPTLAVHRRLYDQVPQQWMDTAKLYVDAGTLKSWEGLKNFHSDQDYNEVLRLLGAYHQTNSKILAGTDVLNPYVIAGFSLHEELQELVKAGLTPFEALKTATVNPGLFLNQPIGTIEKGQRANLLLLKHNPLEKIDHTQTIQAVSVNGTWLDRNFLDDIMLSLRQN